MSDSYIKKSLEGFAVRSVLLTMQAQQDLYLGNPYLHGDRWRGGFGQALRDISCHKPISSNDCSQCSKKAECFYTYFFAIDIPHPYIIVNDLSNAAEISDQETFKVIVRLFGFAISETDRVIQAFERLGRLGIGAKRGRFGLISAQTLDINFHKFFMHEMHTRTIVLQLETPLKLKQERKDLYYGNIDFQTFFRLLLKRIINLNNIYGRGKEFDKETIETEKQALINKAKGIHIRQATKWVDLMRYSSRQATRLKIGGVIGSLVFTGALEDFYDFLKIGEVIHAGLHTTSGFGRYRII